jgi:hypothetical protein
MIQYLPMEYLIAPAFQIFYQEFAAVFLFMVQRYHIVILRQGIFGRLDWDSHGKPNDTVHCLQ